MQGSRSKFNEEQMAADFIDRLSRFACSTRCLYGAMSSRRMSTAPFTQVTSYLIETLTL